MRAKAAILAILLLAASASLMAFKLILPLGPDGPLGEVTIGAGGFNIGGPENSGPFVRWPSRTISYFVNAAGISNLPVTNIEAAVKNSFGAWSTANDGLSFQYLGVTTTGLDAKDRKNTFLWDGDGSILENRWVYAQTFLTYYNPTGEIRDVDIVFNTKAGSYLEIPDACGGGIVFRASGIPIVWTNGEQGARGGILFQNTILADVQTQATHEIGHLLGLFHSDVVGATMATMLNTPTFFCTTDQSVLKSDDIDGVRFLYPAKNIILSQTTASVRLGDAQQFTATVSGLSNTSVSWSVNGIPGGNTTVGAISTGGLYTAPSSMPGPNLNTVSVTATSVADSSKSASATVTLLNPIPIISSASTPIVVGSFMLTVSGNKFVPGSSVNFGGTTLTTTFVSANQLTATGTATASQVGNVPVSVTNPDPGSTTSASINVTVVTSTGNVVIDPASVTVPKGGSQTFTATVSGGGTVAWSVLEGAAGGAITNLGIYTAPNATGTFHVIATNSIDPSKSASATVIVTDSFPVGTITTVAGGGSGCLQQTNSVGDGCPSTSASLMSPSGNALDQAGNLYIADTLNHRIRVVNTQTAPIVIAGVSIQPGNIATVAGTGTAGFSGDNGPATSAQLNNPSDLTLDAVGNLYISDSSNNAIRLVNTQSQAITFGGVSIEPGNIATVAGRGTGCVQQSDSVGDGCPATSAQLGFPDGIALDNTGNLYVTDFYNNRIRKVDRATGLILTVAGNGLSGYSGDGGLATSAQLWAPVRVAIDAAGNLHVADLYNSVVRTVTASTGIITTVAGQLFNGFGWNVFSGDGRPATSANTSVLSVAVDAAGNLYIADYYNERIRAVNTQSITATVLGVSIAPDTIATVVGDGTSGYSGDNGPAVSAHINGPTGLFMDPVGSLYFADSSNGVVRKVTGK